MTVHEFPPEWLDEEAPPALAGLLLIAIVVAVVWFTVGLLLGAWLL